MNVLVLQPGFPAEIPYFVRGLAQAGVRVLGVGDQPLASVPQVAREGLAAYLHVPTLWDAPALIRALRGWDVRLGGRPVKLDRVECLWEAGVELAAQVRQAFGLPGLKPAQVARFRDKHLMREALDRAGVRNPRHARAASAAEVRAAAEHTGFPLIVKPVAGAGSADTYRVDSAAELEALLPRLGAGAYMVEEFVRGTEYTFDTLSAGGKILFRNVELYRPDMLTARSVESVSPQTISLRDLNAPVFARAQAMCERVLAALEFDTGLTHMEWFHTPDDEVVFGEIACRPPGGNSGELMNRTCDFDVYRAWGEVLRHGRLSRPVQRRYNVAMVFKRAQGQGRIHAIRGLGALERDLGPALVRHELRPIGAPRRDWKQTLLSDGFVMLRHPDLDTTLRLADAVAEGSSSGRELSPLAPGVPRGRGFAPEVGAPVQFRSRARARNASRNAHSPRKPAEIPPGLAAESPPTAPAPRSPGGAPDLPGGAGGSRSSVGGDDGAGVDIRRRAERHRPEGAGEEQRAGRQRVQHDGPRREH
ncbi:MAG: ATP-grasp domain-containing protein [Planctomycetota bacterium]